MCASMPHFVLSLLMMMMEKGEYYDSQFTYAHIYLRSTYCEAMSHGVILNTLCICQSQSAMLLTYNKSSTDLGSAHGSSQLHD
jgi:hypothetical protein